MFDPIKWLRKVRKENREMEEAYNEMMTKYYQSLIDAHKPNKEKECILMGRDKDTPHKEKQ